MASFVLIQAQAAWLESGLAQRAGRLETAIRRCISGREIRPFFGHPHCPGFERQRMRARRALRAVRGQGDTARPQRRDVLRLRRAVDRVARDIDAGPVAEGDVGDQGRQVRDLIVAQVETSELRKCRQGRDVLNLIRAEIDVRQKAQGREGSRVGEPRAWNGEGRQTGQSGQRGAGLGGRDVGACQLKNPQ